MNKHPMTATGAERLKAELQRLKTVERPAIVRAIGEARLHGDISENAEYDAAKERQGFLEARIRDIESKLAHAHIVNPAELDAGGRIVFGATVDLEDRTSGDEVSYQIVGDDEADIKAGKISVGLPDRAGAHRQARRRYRRSPGAVGPARIRGPCRALPMTTRGFRLAAAVRSSPPTRRHWHGR